MNSTGAEVSAKASIRAAEALDWAGTCRGLACTALARADAIRRGTSDVPVWDPAQDQAAALYAAHRYAQWAVQYEDMARQDLAFIGEGRGQDLDF